MGYLSSLWDRNSDGLLSVIEKDGNKYMTRIRMPFTRWGHLRVHIFHRGDEDPDPHDHPFDFWTFPLRPYVEEVVNPRDGIVYTNVVRAWVWTKREAEHTHRVIRPVRGSFPLVTLVWAGPWKRKWGFWPPDLQHFDPTAIHRHFVPWKQYLGIEPRVDL